MDSYDPDVHPSGELIAPCAAALRRGPEKTLPKWGDIEHQHRVFYGFL